jgi:hypothetical protein
MRYIGSGTVTSVVVTPATNIVLTTSAGAVTYAFGTYTTIGAVVDAINGAGLFEAKVVDTLRSQASANTIVSTTITAGTDANGVRVWDALIDDSGATTIGVCLSPLGPDFDMPKGHRVHLKELTYNAALTPAATGVRVYLRRGTVETEVYRATSVNTTTTTINWASGQGFISGGPDDELVVFISGTVTNAAANLVRAVGVYE